MTNGEALSTVRKRLGMTKKRAAEKMARTPKTYARYEKEGVDHTTFIAIMRFWGVQVESKRYTTIYFDGTEPLVLTETMNS